MDPDKASEKARALQKPGAVLACFFADNEFNWLMPSAIVAFEEAHEEKMGQKGTKTYKVGQLLRTAVQDMHEGSCTCMRCLSLQVATPAFA
jgi:hypothetical protein